MISQESLSLDWITSKNHEFKGDPVIIEKVIRALILLEALKVEKLDFIFKGGTALMLMIQEPRRFSIDIDIIIEDKQQNITAILDKIITDTNFAHWEEQKRTTESVIDKKHFKLFYEPKVRMKGNLNYILLDVVFETTPYTETQETAVSHFLLAEKEPPIKVITPTLAAILGDKLTAYGPKTTGIPLTKPMELMKQLYDIAGIFDRITSLESVKENFLKVGERELLYRGFDSKNRHLIISDIVDASHNFSINGRLDKESYTIMRSGVSRLNSFVYGDKFREPQAQIAVAKAAYLAKQIEKNRTVIEKFDRNSDMSNWKIEDHNYSGLNKLKKHNLEAFHYWYHTFL